jgi:hypothetical protein
MPNDKTRFTPADLEMFERLRVPKALLERCGVCRVTHSEAWKMGFRAGTGLRMDGILFSHFDAAGNFANGRIRLDNPEIVKGKVKRKYLTLSAKLARRLLYFVPGAGREQLTAELEAVGLVESEKAALALTAAAGRAERKIIFVAMGGCWGAWERRNGKDAPSTPLAELGLLKGKLVRLLLDANVSDPKKPLVSMAEQNLAVVLGPEMESIHLPVLDGINGPDDFLAVQGDEAFWTLWDAPAWFPKAASDLAIFVNDPISYPLSVAVEKATRILATMPEYKLYRRGDGLVHVVEETRPVEAGAIVQRPQGTTYLTIVDAAHLEMDLSRSGYIFQKNFTKGKVRPADPRPKWAEQIVGQLRSRPEGAEWPRLERISNVPLLLPDGGLIDRPGYDAETRVWFDPRGLTFPVIPENPTEADARKAMAVFKQIYGEFPFTQNSYSVALSLIMSLLLRHLLATVPIHCFTAPEPGSGKTKAVEAAAGATTGMDVVRMNYRNLEEFEKHLPLRLMSGDPLVLIDNVGCAITSHELSTAVTTAAELEVRKLGETTRLRTLNRSTFAITGNQLRIGGELPRRCVVARITPNTATPETRQFKFDPPTRARERFPKFAAAALTAARWYLKAKCPRADNKELGSFEEWNRVVRGLLVSLELGDPLATQEEVRATNIDYIADTQLLAALYADFGNEMFTVSEITQPDAQKKTRQSRPLLIRKAEEGWNATWAGIRVGKLRDRILDGLQLQKVKVEHGAVVYKVEGQPGNDISS